MHQKMQNTLTQYFGRRVLVIGLGVSGRAASEFLLKRGAKVCAVDQNRELIDSAEKLAALRLMGLKAVHESDPIDMSVFDFVVVSPGVPPANQVYKAAVAAGLDVIGEVELACRSLSSPCLAITGSNGKTTTTLLVEHVLNCCGKPARALGNVGVPMTQALNEDFEVEGQPIVVAELSSWQLETLRSKVIDAAVILNITANHLDRHKTMDNYAQAKIHIKDCLKPGKKLYMGIQSFRRFNHLLQDTKAKTFGYSHACDIACDGQKVYTQEGVEFILPLDYRGDVSHDVENMMAAFALCREMGISGKQFIEAFASFKKPPHRIEFVRKIGGVAYYDDSKGTNLDAVVKAVQSLKGSTILIAGGVHKGAAYTPWVEAFAGKVRCICAIGQAAEQIKNEIGPHLPVEVFLGFEEAVKYASSQAKEGENVLLSPGCASYDMFKDYQHRGEEFKRIVNSLR